MTLFMAIATRTHVHAVAMELHPIIAATLWPLAIEATHTPSGVRLAVRVSQFKQDRVTIGQETLSGTHPSSSIRLRMIGCWIKLHPVEGWITKKDRQATATNHRFNRPFCRVVGETVDAWPEHRLVKCPVGVLH